MALEYRLKIKTKLSLLNFIERYLHKNKILYSSEIINNGVNVYLFESLGFMISIAFSNAIFFDYLISETNSIEIEWDCSTDIYFRLDKFYNNSIAKLNMIEMCCYILSSTKEDAVLLFNGDILVLERNNGLIKINENFGFWNSNDLLSRIKLII